MQLIDWTRTSLVKHALLPVSGNARRAIRRDGDQSQELIAVSDSNVTSFSIAQRDHATQSADVVIGTCVVRTTPTGGFVVGGRNVSDGEGYGGGYGGGWNGSVCE